MTWSFVKNEKIKKNQVFTSQDRNEMKIPKVIHVVFKTAINAFRT